MTQTFSEALEIVHSLADGNRLSLSRSVEWDENTELLAKWQDDAVDRLHDLVVNHADSLDDLAVPEDTAAAASDMGDTDPWSVTARLAGWERLPNSNEWGFLIRRKVGDSLAVASDAVEACGKSDINPLTDKKAKDWLSKPSGYLSVCISLAEQNVIDPRDTNDEDLALERERQVEAIRIASEGAALHRETLDQVVTIDVSPVFRA